MYTAVVVVSSWQQRMQLVHVMRLIVDALMAEILGMRVGGLVIDFLIDL